MALVIVRNKNVLTLDTISIFALRSIYEPENFSIDNERQMKESIIAWKNHLDHRKEIGYDPKTGKVLLSTVDEENLHRLQEICFLLDKFYKGELNARIRSFKAHNIDWRKFHKLPGAITEADKAKAQELLAKSNQREGISNEN